MHIWRDKNRLAYIASGPVCTYISLPIGSNHAVLVNDHVDLGKSQVYIVEDQSYLENND